MSVDFEKLAAPFRAEDIHWRAQTVIFRDDKYAAMALAYMDARDVMARLDEVVGPANWQDSYAETAKGRVICTLSIRINDEWVGKSDGAGDTAVEGEKGGVSDAFKRAAVKWGIGRYLYDMETPWAPCEGYTTEKNGKKVHGFKKWLPSALAKFKDIASRPPMPRTSETDASLNLMLDGIKACETLPALKEHWERNWPAVPDHHRPAVLAAKEARKTEINTMDRIAA